MCTKRKHIQAYIHLSGCALNWLHKAALAGDNVYPPKLSTSMIGQGEGAIHSLSSASDLPPPLSLASLTGDADVDMLACSPFDSFAAAPPPNNGDCRRPSAKAPHPSEVLKCPRCESLDTKFCYYNNYSLTQPRYFCKNCKRYWTAGGALRNVPVGGGLRKNKRSKLKLAADAEAALAAQAMAASGAEHQQQQITGAFGAGVLGEVPQMLDNRTSNPAIAAVPSGVAIGIPGMGMYPHPSRGRATARKYSEPTLDQNSSAVVDEQEGNFYGRSAEKGTGLNYCVEPGHVPQFYSSYATSLPVQYGNPIAGGVESSFPMGCTFLLPCKSASNVPEEEAPNDRTVHEADASNRSTATRAAAKQEEDAEAAGNPYDWQLISEGLFSSGGSTTDGNFFYMPSSSWSEFSHFNDAGPG